MLDRFSVMTEVAHYALARMSPEGKRYLEEGKTNCIRTRTSTIYTYYSLLLRFYILWYACITQAFNSEGERRPGKLVMSGGCVWRLSKNSPKWFYV